MFVRAANKEGLAKINDTSNIKFVDGDTVATTVAVTDAVGGSGSGVSSFTMVDKALTIVDATVDAAEIEALAIKNDGTTINVKLKSAFTFSTATETKTADLIKAEFVADYINAHKDGWSAEVVKKAAGAEQDDFAKMVLTNARGTKAEVTAISSITTSTTAKVVTVDGKAVVTDGTNNKISDIAAFAGLGDKVSVQHKNNTVDCYVDATSQAAVVTDGDVIVSVTDEVLNKGNPDAPTITEAKDQTVILNGDGFKNLPDLSRIMGCATTSSGNKPFPTDCVNYNILGSHKLAIMNYYFPVNAEAGKYVRIELVNNAQKIYDQDATITGNVKVVSAGSSPLSKAITQLAFSTPVWDDGEDILLKVWIGDSDLSATTAEPDYTITYKTNEVTFAD